MAQLTQMLIFIVFTIPIWQVTQYLMNEHDFFKRFHHLEFSFSKFDYHFSFHQQLALIIKQLLNNVSSF